jgi:hypothetical protein
MHKSLSSVKRDSLKSGDVRGKKERYESGEPAREVVWSVVGCLTAELRGENRL